MRVQIMKVSELQTTLELLIKEGHIMSSDEVVIAGNFDPIIINNICVPHVYKLSKDVRLGAVCFTTTLEIDKVISPQKRGIYVDGKI